MINTNNPGTKEVPFFYELHKKYIKNKGKAHEREWRRDSIKYRPTEICDGV